MSAHETVAEQDSIDLLAGLAADSPLAALRRQRPEIVRRSQQSEAAALRPSHPGRFDPALRAALACRIATLLKDAVLAAHFHALLDGADDRLLAIAAAQANGESDTRLAAIIRHVDLVTLTPAKAIGGDIAALRAAGLGEADIVTLSGIIAFVNFQARVAAGLRMMKGA